MAAVVVAVAVEEVGTAVAAGQVGTVIAARIAVGTAELVGRFAVGIAATGVKTAVETAAGMIAV